MTCDTPNKARLGPDLIADLEAATEGSRELDAQIARRLHKMGLLDRREVNGRKEYGVSDAGAAHLTHEFETVQDIRRIAAVVYGSQEKADRALLEELEKDHG